MCFDTGLVPDLFKQLGRARPPRSLVGRARPTASVPIVRSHMSERELTIPRQQLPGQRDRVVAPSCSSTPTTICLNISMPPGWQLMEVPYAGALGRPSGAIPISTCGFLRGGVAQVISVRRACRSVARRPSPVWPRRSGRAMVDDRAQRRENYGWSAPGNRVTVDAVVGALARWRRRRLGMTSAWPGVVCPRSARRAEPLRRSA